MPGPWGILLFTWAEKSPQWGQGRRRTGGRHFWTSQGQGRRVPRAPMALSNVWDPQGSPLLVVLTWEQPEKESPPAALGPSYK